MDLIAWLLDKSPGLIALGTLAYWIFKTITKPVKKIQADVNQLSLDTAHLKTDFEKVKDNVVEVTKELNTNGGGSLKDAVKNVEKSVGILTTETAAQTKKLETLATGHIEIKAAQAAFQMFVTPRLQRKISSRPKKS